MRLINKHLSKAVNIKKQFKVKETGRLKSRKLIEQLFKAGKSFGVFPFRVFYMGIEENSTTLLAGFGASAKNFKKAVDRNRIKRLTREAYRLQKNELYEAVQDKKSHLALFFIYTGKELPLYALVKEKMGIIIKRLITITNENDSSPA